MSRRVIVHNLAQARAAIAAAETAGKPVTLMSTPGAAGYVGAPYWRELMAAAGADKAAVAVTAILDCGDKPGHALGALAEGIECVRVAASDDVLARIADIAARSGAALDTVDARALDLLDVKDAEAALRDWFEHRG